MQNDIQPICEKIYAFDSQEASFRERITLFRESAAKNRKVSK